MKAFVSETAYLRYTRGADARIRQSEYTFIIENSGQKQASDFRRLN